MNCNADSWHTTATRGRRHVSIFIKRGHAAVRSSVLLSWHIHAFRRICACIHTTKCLFVVVVPVLEMLWNNITDLEGIWEWKQTSLFLVRLLGWVSSKQTFREERHMGWVYKYRSILEFIMILDMVHHSTVYIQFTIYFYLEWVSDILWFLTLWWKENCFILYIFWWLFGTEIDIETKFLLIAQL